ncbi:MAG: CoA-binding protein [Eubacteriales bacterium]|nr:CoA-binding protein [Eubacteriales bacterium]
MNNLKEKEEEKKVKGLHLPSIFMNNEQKMKELMNKRIWAIVGATPNTEKIANRIYHTFKNNGYEVFAVNPNYEKMDDGSKCFSCLEDLPKTPDCIDFVVPPAITMKTLTETDPDTIPNIWLQPGTYNDNIVKYAEEKGFTVVHEGACALVYLNLHGKQ